MKYPFLFLFFLASLFAKEQYVTYDFSGGRFGDCLISYLHAKWFSYQHNIPLLYKPFEYSVFLKLHDQERIKPNQPISRRVSLDKWALLSKLPWVSCIYKCPYFPESTWEKRNHRFPHFQVDWKDKGFRAMVRELISPKGKLALLRPPEGKFSIAVHVREGGGYDFNGFVSFPTKFPPLSFYIDGLKLVLEKFGNQPLYCFLFTDAVDPAFLVEQIRKELPVDADIEFDFRKHNNAHDAHVLEDFFSLFEFDVLIRPASNFSLIPSLLHDYALVYAAEDYDDVKNQIIAQVEIGR